MRRSRHTTEVPTGGSKYGAAIIGIGLLAFIAYMIFTAQYQIQQIHRELFNADAPIDYELDFTNYQVIAKTRIVSQPRRGMEKWNELPFLSQSQTYRITHHIGFGTHTGVIELKVGDNSKSAEFLSSDITLHFSVGSDSVTLNAAPFSYDAPDFRLNFGGLEGSFTFKGELKLSSKTLEMKMVNYLIRFSDFEIELSRDRKKILLKSANILIDDVKLEKSQISFTGTNPFEVRMDSTFKSLPVEIDWSIQKTNMQKQDLKIGSGRIKFPVSLLDSYIEPQVDRLLISQEKESRGTSSDKIRFLFSAAKEVRKAEARAIALRKIASTKSIQQEDGFYIIRIDKQDAFLLADEIAQKKLERKTYIDSWIALPRERMIEEAFYAVVFGDDTRALAVKEFIELKEKEFDEDPLFGALKARSALRDALVSVDEYNPTLLENASGLISQVVQKIPKHKLATLLRLEISKTRADKELTYQLYEEFRNMEQDPQIRAMFEFMKYIHVDNPKALESLELAHAINPTSFYVQNLLRNKIHIHEHMGNLAGIEEVYKKLLSEAKPTPRDYLGYSKLLIEKKDFPTALAIVEKCIELDSLNKECQDQKENIMTLIAYSKQEQNPEEAVGYLENLINDRPASISANAGLGYLYRLKGNDEKSIQHYSIACALGGPSACIEAGDFLSNKNEIEKAMLLFDISCDLKSGNGCLKAGLHAKKSGQADRSGYFYDRSCNEYQDNVGCYHLARSLQLKRRPNSEIVPYLTRACKLYNSACKLANVYRTSRKQPAIPVEPK